ncbi:hypothetical protein D9615_007032 [Tricholomella constricta]|uniref:Major facilitator superfamily (MFS) profile domain-containing protein n=1 Tax=Tricholomella constricta TaxID=117010 RepID=A0A8H5H7U7_9AGAR|nr:hypothetical protein D9615_007032 [Tricholomella constricta]
MGPMSTTSSTTLHRDVEDLTSMPGSKEFLPPDPFEVHLDPEEHPQNIPLLRKWIAVIVISCASLCVTCSSSVATFTETGVAAEFRVHHLVTVLALSLFVEGLGLGPLLVGPLSEMYGRNIVYRVSYGLLFLASFPVAFAPNASVYLVFRFISGFCGAAFLSVAGGSSRSEPIPFTPLRSSILTLPPDSPMALYTISPFIGPVLGPLLSGFINQNLYWRWTYRIQSIWIFVQYIALLALVPETYEPVLVKRKARRLRISTGDLAYWAPLDKEDRHLLRAIAISCYRPFQLVMFDRMALLLDLWTALILGILYLAFQAFPIIFSDGHGFNMQTTGMTFLGIGLGMVLAISSQPFWNRLFEREGAKHGGQAPPETRLIMGQLGGVLVPIGLFSLAFTTYPHVHWIAPIIASVPFGAGIYFVFTSTFTYLVTAYRPIAASAMAANSALRSNFAAVFPLFAGTIDGPTTVSRISAIRN